MSLLYQVCAFHWFIKRHWKTSELRTFETMTTRVTVAAVVVVGVGGNLAQFLRFVCTVKFWDLRSGYDELIVPPHYVEWMLHSGSLSNLQLGSRCGHLRIYVLRHIFPVLHRFGSVVPETIFTCVLALFCVDLCQLSVRYHTSHHWHKPITHHTSHCRSTQGSHICCNRNQKKDMWSEVESGRTEEKYVKK